MGDRRCLLEGDSLSTGKRQLVYRWERKCLLEGDRGLLSVGDRVSTGKETGCLTEGDRWCLSEGER